MAQVHATLSLRPKWWMRPAIFAAAVALHLRLVKPKPDPRYLSGHIEPVDRVAEWLARYAFRMEIR